MKFDRDNGARRVVVTGLGAVTAWGWGTEPFWEGLLSGESRIDAPRAFPTEGQRTHLAGEAPEAPAEVSASIPGWDQISRADRFAVAAAFEAIRGAGLEDLSPRAGVFFGSSTAGMLEGEEFYARLSGERPGHPRLRFLASHQINGPGDAVARGVGVNGPVYTVSSACSSGALAIGEALRALASGEVDIAICGGADSLCQLTYSGFNSLRAMDEDRSRPFLDDRAGLNLGEGAGVLVLETFEGAAVRGARPLAEVRGVGASCDSHHMTAPHPEGEGAALAIERSLADADLGPGDVDFVNAHGTGTPLNDIAEWKAMCLALGENAERIPVTSIKGAIGHLLGTAGAIEVVATVLSLDAGSVPPTAGKGEVDSNMEIDLVRGEPRRLPRPAVGLSTSLAFGGSNVVLVLSTSSEEVVT